MDMKSNEIVKEFKGLDVVYIYHNTIDARGDHASTEREVFEATEDAFKEIINLVYTVTSTGDKQKDKKELEQLNKDCKILETEVKDLEGIRVVCSLNNGINSVKQTFDYASLDTTKVSAAFSEAGGVLPQFKYKDNIDKVESKMLTSGYTCEKVSS